MGSARTYEDREAGGRAALQAVLAASFAVRQLEAQSSLYLYGSGVPALALWLNAGHPLPGLLAWFAALAWALCVFMSFALAAIALARRAQLAQELPDAVRIARLHFSPSEDPAPFGSTILVWLAVAASAVLCSHAMAPQWLGADVVEVGHKSWIILFAGALGCRYVETR